MRAPPRQIGLMIEPQVDKKLAKAAFALFPQATRFYRWLNAILNRLYWR